MKTLNKILKHLAAVGFLMLAFFADSQFADAATYNLDFYTTTVGAGSGPVNPTNGAVAISGANLAKGDVVVFDGLAISQNPGTGDQWAGINLNGGGLHGVVNASLGVKAETANGTGHSQLFPMSLTFADVGATTNHVRIVLTVTTAGSTTNMTYLAETDPNFTGTFTDALTGTVTFPGNTIPLTFGAQAQGQAFYDTSGALGIATTPSSSPPLLAGMTQTFTAIYQGPPSSSFQWLSNNVPIAGATSLTYTTPPITAANNGDQYAIVLYTNLIVAVTSAPSVLNYHANPVTWVFNFPNTNWLNGGAADTTPIVSTIANTYFAAGDTVVFDGIITGNGPWGGPAINSFGGIPAAGLGVLLRFGGNGANGAVYANAVNVNNNLTTVAAVTNHLRIELYLSANTSLTNMGWKVLLDQNLTGTYSIIQTGTNLTFAATSLWLQFESQNCSSISFAQNLSSIGYAGGPFTYNGSGLSPTITYGGSTGVRTTNYVGTGATVYSSVNSPTNAGTYYVSNTVASDTAYIGTTNSLAFTIQQAPSVTTTVGAGPFTYDGTAHAGGSGTVTGAGGLSASATSLTYSGDQVDAGTYSVTAHYAGDANHTASDGLPVVIAIQQAPSVTTTVGAGPFTYDGTTHAGGSGTVTGAGGLSASATSLTYSGDQVDAGTYSVTAHYAGDANHAASDGAPVAITIQPAASATTTVGAGPFTYDGTTHAGGSGTVIGAGGLSTSATSLTYSGDQVDVGTYYVTAHYAGDSNHTSSDGSAVGITISTATTAFSGLSSVTNSYGVTNIILTGVVSASGPVYPASGEAVSASINGFSVNGTVTNGTGAFYINYNDSSLATNSVAGTPYTITFSYAGNANLGAVSDGSTSLTITNALLTITANNDSKVYDGTAYSGGNGVMYTGFVNAETSAVLNGALTYGGTAQGAVDANTYTIVAGGLASTNYAIMYSPGTLTVQPAPSTTTTVGDGPFTYSGTIQTGGAGTVTGAGGLNASATSLTYSGDQVDAGTYYVTAHYAGDLDHIASDGLPVAITIQQATSTTTTVGAGPFTYDGTTHAGGSGTVIGAGGLSTSATSLTYSGDQIDAGTYYVTAHYSGDANHSASDGSVVGIVINPLAITVTAQTNVKLFDDTTSATNAPMLTSGALAAGDAAVYTEVYQDANVGAGKTLIPSVTITNASSANVTGNYAVTLVNNSTGVINAVAPTVISAKMIGGTFQVLFTGPGGQPYEVLGNTDLGPSSGSWVTNSSGIFPGGDVTYTNQNPTDTRHFYRIQSP